MTRTLVIACLAGVILGGWRATAAVAHGPCGCLDPVLTEPGNKVRIGPERGQAGLPGVPAYRVMFNPRPSDFGIAPGYLASAYRADAPSATVLSRSRHEPTRKGRFRVPKGTPPGLYMVVIWDGGEGGGHNTWDYLHVTDWDEPDGRGVVAQQDEPSKPVAADSPMPKETGGTGDSIAWPLVAGVGLGGLLLAVAGSRAAARRRA